MDIIPDLSQINSSTLAFRSYDGSAALQAEKAGTIRTVFVERFIMSKGANGKEYKVSKQTCLRILTDPFSDVDYRKSHDWLIRVRTFGSSIGGHSNTWDVVQPNLHRALPKSKILSLGSLFSTLISTDGQGVSLDVLQCTSIKVASRLVDSPPTDEITLHNSSYDIGGQILELIPFSSPQPFSEPPHSIQWIWTSAYVRLDKPTKSRAQTSVSATARVTNLNFVVNGQLVYPLTNGEPVSVDVASISYLFKGFLEFFGQKLKNRDRTWQLNDQDLWRAQAELIRRAQDKDVSAKIPIT
ncbi:hypothetical protein EST38_g3754 [Candolleomyces aberdarensis]|uniref:Uncharacterized protein n=1 Tax=Candolleomyces aberdarensis TaxID=2316362 RepID=A0A4Q2DPY2_9AGAR|nr:hypothetical protein EST38_g3754 [Candolleomyces aberdarensis]